MHEKREISSTPWSDEQGRSAKATSRTADMYVPQKSDRAVLPVNQPNKGGELSAEAGEGRAQTRENIAQSHMHPTQSGKRMSQGLDGVRKAAKERKQERFTALLGTGKRGKRENQRPSHSWVSLTSVGSASATRPSSSGGLLRRSEWSRSSKPSRLSFNAGCMIAWPKSVPWLRKVEVCQFFCVNGPVLFLGMGARGKG
jgi:hypothetical protein